MALTLSSVTYKPLSGMVWPMKSKSNVRLFSVNFFTSSVLAHRDGRHPLRRTSHCDCWTLRDSPAPEPCSGAGDHVHPEYECIVPVETDRCRECGDISGVSCSSTWRNAMVRSSFVNTSISDISSNVSSTVWTGWRSLVMALIARLSHVQVTRTSSFARASPTVLDRPLF